MTLIDTMNYTLNGSVAKIYDCGYLTYSLANKVNGTIKVIIIIMMILLFFEMWAIKRVIHSGESHDKKAELIDIILTFIHPIIIVFVFYMIYWIFLSGIDW